MKYSLAVVALLGMTNAMSKNKADFFTDDPRSGTSAMPVYHGAGGFAKPTKKFEIPKNTESEPALSRTLDPYDYSTGSGRTYHDLNPKATAEKYMNESHPPPAPAGWNEPDETAGTTNTMKTNANDGPSSFKAQTSFAQKFGLNPSAPIAESLL